MKKKILLIGLLAILGCGTKMDSDSYVKEAKKVVYKKSDESFLEDSTRDKLKTLKKEIETLYKESGTLSYTFIGDLNLPMTALIEGKKLILPIYPLKTSQHITLDIGVFFNLENSETEVYIENFFVNYDDFKAVMTEASEYIELTQGKTFGKYILEKKMTKNQVVMAFPQGEKRLFNVFMTFDELNNVNTLNFQEEVPEKNGRIMMTFKNYKIVEIAKQLNSELISNAINTNIPKLESEVQQLLNSYNELNKTLDKK